MATITPPSNEQNFVVIGDLDILNALSSNMGDGSIYVRNGGCYVAGLTELNETTVVTNDGPFTVNGSSEMTVDVTAAISLSAAATSDFTTTTGSLTFQASDVSAGNVLVEGAGSGPDSVKLLASNATNGQVNIASSGGASATPSLVIQATDTTNGVVNISGAGNMTAGNPAVKIAASNAAGQVQVTSAGDSSSQPAIVVSATGTTGGNISMTAAGDYTGSVAAVSILATDTTSGKIVVQSSGAAADSVLVNSVNGGVSVTGAGAITIDTADTTNGITIGGTSLVPVTIGSSGSLTTIQGNLIIEGETTTINTVTLTVDNNVAIFNSGSEVSGIDAGLAIRRYQTPNNTPSGDVISTPNPIVESGAFQAGSATPGTLVLSPYTSVSNGFYNGWWVSITSGTGINQVRRIHSYVGSTHTATLYVTADNNTDPNVGAIFEDGQDLITAPADGDTYELFNSCFIGSYYDETNNRWSISSIANADQAGITGTNVQNPQQLDVGSIDIEPQFYKNAFVSASGTALSVTLRGHGMVAGSIIYLQESANLTPSPSIGNYTVTSVTDVNTFVITAAASTTSGTDSSVGFQILNSSVLKVNVIEPYSAGFPISISGLSLIETISVPKTSTADFTITNSSTSGGYIVMVSDTNNAGAYAIFSAVCSSGSAGSVSRIAGSMGAQGQRLMLGWASGQQLTLYQSPAGSGSGNYNYLVRLFSAL